MSAAEPPSPSGRRHRRRRSGLRRSLSLEPGPSPRHRRRRARRALDLYDSDDDLTLPVRDPAAAADDRIEDLLDVDFASDPDSGDRLRKIGGEGGCGVDLFVEDLQLAGGADSASEEVNGLDFGVIDANDDVCMDIVDVDLRIGLGLGVGGNEDVGFADEDCCEDEFFMETGASGFDSCEAGLTV